MIILVTGKSGSGKSTFAKVLSEKLGYKYIDFDNVVHRMYESDEFTKKVVLIFGNDILNNEGKVDRKKVGKIMFTTPTSKQVLEYNDFSYKQMKKIIDSEMTKNTVLDYALLPIYDYWNSDGIKVLVKAKDDNERIKRILKRDNISREYFLKRESASLDFEKYDYDFVIENDYTINFEKGIENLAKLIKKY